MSRMNDFLTSLWFFHNCLVRSPVFAAMLESDLAEVQSGTLIITDMSSKAMKELLKYLYTGSLKTTPDTTMEIDLVAELLNASEKVHLKLFKSFNLPLSLTTLTLIIYSTELHFK
jgi:hypothetical protein